MRRHGLLWVPVALLLALGVGVTAAGDEGLPPVLKLYPPAIDMGFAYGGAKLKVAGSVSAGSQILIVIRGPSAEETFNKKARLGPIWTNAGKVHVKGVPSIFLCYSSAPVEKLLNRESLDRFQLDEAAIKTQMVVEPKAMDVAAVRANYLALKKQQGFFEPGGVGIRTGSVEEGRLPYSLAIPWSRKAPPASYEVAAYECREGSVVGRAAAPLLVREVGFPKTVADLAREKAYLYGVLCVLMAAVAGFGIDLLGTLLGKRGLASH